MELLYHLASTPNRVYTRNQLLDEVWGFDYFGDTRTVDVHIKRLREKLEGVSDQWDLKTVWASATSSSEVSHAHDIFAIGVTLIVSLLLAATILLGVSALGPVRALCHPGA